MIFPTDTTGDDPLHLSLLRLTQTPLLQTPNGILHLGQWWRCGEPQLGRIVALREGGVGWP
jgi:hypothetical protein